MPDKESPRKQPRSPGTRLHPIGTQNTRHSGAVYIFIDFSFTEGSTVQEMGRLGLRYLSLWEVDTWSECRPEVQRSRSAIAQWCSTMGCARFVTLMYGL